MIDGNPFILVYDKLWDLAETSEYLKSLVRVKNRIRFDHTRPGNPIKEEVSETDLPELLLVATAGTPNIRNTSSTSMIVRQYDWLISTGDMSASNKLLPVEWALFAAMAAWPSVLCTLKWPEGTEDSFVKRANITGLSVGFSDPERNRGIVGWSSVWGIEVEMHFATSDLIEVGTAEDTGTGTGTGS